MGKLRLKVSENSSSTQTVPMLGKKSRTESLSVGHDMSWIIHVLSEMKIQMDSPYL